MADKKLEKALYGPSTTEVILGAILGLLAGVAVACVYLVFKPVPTVKEMPKEPVRGTVYFLPGSDSRAKSKDWEAKLKQFLAGASVQVTEDELNAWIMAQKTPAPAKTAAAPAAPAAATPAPVEGFVIPGTPNVRIAGDVMQVGLPCTLNWFGLATDVTVQARGTFQKSGDVYVFVPQSVHLGSCPLHIMPGFGGLLLDHVLEKQKLSDDLRAAWAKLGEVSIVGGTLSLQAP
jgi:hypothetical protein